MLLVVAIVAVVCSNTCKLKRSDLNLLRVHSEELAWNLNLIPCVGESDLHAYNRSVLLAQEMLEKLSHCT